jgi:hypothetical protein
VTAKITARDNPIGSWLRLDRFGPELWRDGWFIVAALLAAAFAVTSILTTSWYGVLTSVFIFYWVGLLRHFAFWLGARRAKTKTGTF